MESVAVRPHLDLLPHDDIVIDGQQYMRRWWIVRTRFFEARIHYTSSADVGEHVHDHPFDFITIVMKGTYDEYLASAELVRHRRGVPFFRQAEVAHAIDKISQGGVWSLVLTGPRRREWGFYVDGNWVHEETYRTTQDRTP